MHVLLSMFFLVAVLKSVCALTKKAHNFLEFSNENFSTKNLFRIVNNDTDIQSGLSFVIKLFSLVYKYFVLLYKYTGISNIYKVYNMVIFFKYSSKNPCYLEA